MAEIHALIAAAGKGSRAGLGYPKTLYSVQGKPILIRILDLLHQVDSRPTVIVSPEGECAVSTCLAETQRNADLVVQTEAKGMGDAVLCYMRSPAFRNAEHVLLIWGDIPFIQEQTLATLLDCHLSHGNDFTFATRHVDSAYTVVSRDAHGQVTGVVETRESGQQAAHAGERDIGLFIFRKAPVLEALLEERPEKFGKATGEHGFLYVIGLLAARGLKVEALPVATELDLVSLNRLEDVDGFH